jgi:hypothetical protein
MAPHGTAVHLDPANRRDEMTPFRWYMLRIRARESRRGTTDLTLDYLKRVWDRQGGVCPLTGWPMQLPYNTNGWPAGSVPESASLDRIDNARGYVCGNVRFVSLMVNMARHTFTDDDVLRFARAVVLKHGA